MVILNEYVNKVLVDNCFKSLLELPPDSVDLCVTSPPFWGLRDYGEASTIFGGNPLCEHEFKETIVKAEYTKIKWQHEEGGNGHNRFQKQDNPRAALEEEQKTRDVHQGFCIKCGAWKGQLGLEPHPQMFIDHLVEFGRLVRQVLKPSGLFWLNLGDTYFSTQGNNSSYQKPSTVKNEDRRHYEREVDGSNWLQPKQLLMIPARVACALQNDDGDDIYSLRDDLTEEERKIINRWLETKKLT